MSRTTELTGAALNRGQELRAAGQHADALAVYASTLDRLGVGLGAAGRQTWWPAGETVAAVGLEGGEGDWTQAAWLVAAGDPEACGAVARTLFNAAGCLVGTARRGLAIDLYQEIVDRFSAIAEPSMQRLVAGALWSLALNLEKDERLGEGLDALDALVARFSDAADDRLRSLVGFALSHKAVVMTRTGQVEKAVAAHRELAAQRFEAIDPRLADVTASSLLTVAGHAAQAGRSVETLAVLDDLLERFPRPVREKQRKYVASGLYLKAVVLNELGESDQALGVYGVLIDRFANDEPAVIRLRVVDAMQNKVAILDRDGSRHEADELLDEILGYLAGSVEPELVRKRVQSLAARAMVLDQAGREAEELLVHNNLVETYLGLAPEDRDQETLDRVIGSVLTRARVPDNLHPRTSALVDQLVMILTDVTDPDASQSEPERGPVPEQEIAGLLTDLYQRQFWFEFATSTTDPASLKTMQETALVLYERTGTWMQLTGGDQEAPVSVAVMLIRQIADGYALLAHPWTADQKARLNLPLRIGVEWAMREAHLDDWATEHGHRLDLPDSQELAEELMEQHVEREQTGPDLVTPFMISVRRYQMLLALCDSPAGQVALRTPQIRSLTEQQLEPARAFAGYIGSHDQDAAGIGVLCLLIAEAYFVASHAPVSASRDLFPNPAFARRLLRITDAYEWINNQGIELPNLLAE